jgi:PKD repeat protein
MNKCPARILFAALILLAGSTLLIPGSTARDPCESWDYPQVDFTFTVIDTESFPVPVQFNGTYTTRADEPIDRWKWSFGDGLTRYLNRDGSAPGWLNVINTYSSLRNYFTVCAEGTTICGANDMQCHDVVVRCTAPTAGFMADSYEGSAPLTIRVTDTSEHTPGSATSWEYTTDGGTIATERDFSKTFPSPGVYTITQTVKKNCNPRSDSFSRTIHVTPAIVQAYILDLSIPTTTPTIRVAGINFGNMSYITTTTSPASTPSMTVPATATASPAASFTSGTSAIPVRRGSISPVPAIPRQVDPVLPGTGALSVITDPAGARVYVDDVLRGVSPSTVPNLATGPHMLRLEREGYRNMTVPVDISEGKTTDYSTALVPASDGGMGLLPLIAVAALVIAAIGGIAFFFTSRKRAP